MPLANLLVGAAMLLFGRRLFWVFVAGSGFAVGAFLSVELLKERGGPMVLAVAIAAGVVGALIALFAQKMAVAIAGFLAGGYLGYALAVALHAAFSPWIAGLVGGVIGTLLLVALFDWTLIALSSLVGASVIAHSAPLTPPWPVVLFVVLLGFGLAWQGRQLRGKPPAPQRKG